MSIAPGPAVPGGRVAPPIAVPAGSGSWADEPGGQLIFFAVLEGLYVDGVQQEVVRAVLAGPPPDDATDDVDVAPERSPEENWQRELERTLFVPGCPLCTPVLVAFELYAARAWLHLKDWDEHGRPRDTFGRGLPDAVVARLLSVDRAERLAALEELVGVWIARRLDFARATEAERGALQAWMEEGRKLGMGQLSRFREELDPALAAGWTRCASCEGAVSACGVR